MSEISTKKRPLSPHLQIYKPQLTSVLSVLHRATGVALAFGLVLVTWWLAALAAGPADFNLFQNFAAHPIGQFMIIGWAFSLIYHLLNGIRHLMWDAGRGLDLKTTYRTGWLVVWGSVIVTLLLVLSAYNII